jgi:hypothetical protein
MYERSTTTAAAPSVSAYVPDKVVLLKYEYPKPELIADVMGISPGVITTTCQRISAGVERWNQGLGYRSTRSPPLRVDTVQLLPCSEGRVLVVYRLWEPFTSGTGAGSTDDRPGRFGGDILDTSQCCLGCDPRPKRQHCSGWYLHGGQIVARTAPVCLKRRSLKGDGFGKKAHTTRNQFLTRRSTGVGIFIISSSWSCSNGTFSSTERRDPCGELV